MKANNVLMEEVIDRVNLLKPTVEPDLIEEFVRIVMDRINLVLGEFAQVGYFPEELASVVVLVACAMANQQELNHEGVESETVDVFSMRFLNDQLAPYMDDIMRYKANVTPKPIDSERGFQFL